MFAYSFHFLSPSLSVSSRRNGKEMHTDSESHYSFFIYMLDSLPFRILARALTSRGTAPGFVNIARPCDASDITVRKVYIASCKLSAPNHGRITNFVTTEYANVCNAHVVVAHVSPQGSVHSQMACLCDVPSNGIGKYGVLRH